jgi:endonuclease/exonuclease/phosphatase family metal-dependent hydrolase
MEASLREIALQMDQFLGDAEISLRDVINWHRWQSETPDSSKGFREIARRHLDGQTIKFLSYNTYLLEAHIDLPNPLSDVEVHAKPAMHERAKELGKIIRDEYDFASLYEVMQEEQKSEILSAWGESPPTVAFGGALSSLCTISPKFPIKPRQIGNPKKYIHKGKTFVVNLPVGPKFEASLDSDFYSHKGVLLTEIDIGVGVIEVYSTHLMFGGGLPKALETVINAMTTGDHISPANSDERLTIELQQIDELIDFYVANHHPKNVAIICGDFNIDGSDPIKFAKIKNRLQTINMRDAWAEGPFPNLISGGQTCRNDDGEGARERDFTHACVPLAAANADLVCDDSVPTQSTSDVVGRFDYLFVEEPQIFHTFNLDLSRVRRRGFRRPQVTDDQEFLSDHLGLETTLVVSRLQ